MLGMVRNSALITVSIICLRLVVAMLAAYAIAKIRYRGSNIVMVGFLSSMMLPDSGDHYPHLHHHEPARTGQHAAEPHYDRHI